jgi:RNA polymerase sigma-70 factor, ECF subfamily
VADTNPSVTATAHDRASIEAVYRLHHGFVWRSVRRLGVDEAAVDDAVHEVFMVALRRLDQFEGRAEMRTWLFAIAMNVVKNHRRAQWRHRRRAEALARQTDIQSSAGSAASPADAYARSDAARTLHRLLAELPEEQRAAFILSELEGLSAPEIAEALQANVNTIYTRIRVARQRMQEAAAAERSGDERTGDEVPPSNERAEGAGR